MKGEIELRKLGNRIRYMGLLEYPARVERGKWGFKDRNNSAFESYMRVKHILEKKKAEGKIPPSQKKIQSRDRKTLESIDKFQNEEGYSYYELHQECSNTSHPLLSIYLKRIFQAWLSKKPLNEDKEEKLTMEEFKELLNYVNPKQRKRMEALKRKRLSQT